MYYRVESGKTRTIRQRLRRLLQRLVSRLLTQPLVQFRYFRFQLLGINVPFASHFFRCPGWQGNRKGSGLTDL
jgi:hypothetical protein